ELQGRDDLAGEEFRAAAVISQRCRGRNDVLVAEEAAKIGFHAPDRQQRASRHAVAFFDLRKQLRVLLLDLTALAHDLRRATPFHELVQRQLEALLATIGLDRRRVVAGAVKRRERALAKAARLRMLTELRFPRLE